MIDRNRGDAALVSNRGYRPSSEAVSWRCAVCPLRTSCSRTRVILAGSYSEGAALVEQAPPPSGRAERGGHWPALSR